MLSNARPFNMNVLRVALHLGEDSIAAVLAAHYDVLIDEDIFDIAVKKSMFTFL